MAKMNGTGQGGKSFQDRQLAAEVRTKAIQELKLVLSDDKKVEKWSEYKRQMLLRLAPALLPRLNEVSGENGDPIVIKLVEYGDNDSASV